MKEVVLNTHKNEVVGRSTIYVYGLNDQGAFVVRTPMDCDEAIVIRNRHEYKEVGVTAADAPGRESTRKLQTHDGRSEMLGGDGISAFDSWLLAEVPEEWWDGRCGDEKTVSERQAERVGGIVRKIRRQMKPPIGA